MVCNNSDRRQWRKQGAVVGAAASEMQADAKQLLGAATRISCPRRKLPTRRVFITRILPQLFKAEPGIKMHPLRAAEEHRALPL